MANQNPPQFGTRTLEDFKARLIGGGARPNLFEVEINFPTFALVGDTPGTGINDDTRSVSDLTQFMCKAAQLPASNIAEIPVPFRGRVLKVAGDRTFDPWTITVVNDTDFKIRTAFEKWMNGINRVNDNSGVITPSQYQTDCYVRQLGRGVAGSATGPKLDSNIPVLKTYRFYGVFPTNVSEIEVSYDSSDIIEEFTVTLQVQWWDALRNGTSDMGVPQSS
jgi:hypothetical protein|tara:strand:- start:53 stop:715 length:663 start_codon:yes stop_codon:yes gene_type:complete